MRAPERVLLKRLYHGIFFRSSFFTRRHPPRPSARTLLINNVPARVELPPVRSWRRRRKKKRKRIHRASEKLLMKPADVRLHPIGTNWCVHARHSRSPLPFIRPEPRSFNLDDHRARLGPPSLFVSFVLISPWKFEDRYPVSAREGR